MCLRFCRWPMYVQIRPLKPVSHEGRQRPEVGKQFWYRALGIFQGLNSIIQTLTKYFALFPFLWNTLRQNATAQIDFRYSTISNTSAMSGNAVHISDFLLGRCRKGKSLLIGLTSEHMKIGIYHLLVSRSNRTIECFGHLRCRVCLAKYSSSAVDANRYGLLMGGLRHFMAKSWSWQLGRNAY